MSDASAILNFNSLKTYSNSINVISHEQQALSPDHRDFREAIAIGKCDDQNRLNLNARFGPLFVCSMVCVNREEALR